MVCEKPECYHCCMWVVGEVSEGRGIEAEGRVREEA